jgi:hypothetical protein
MAGRKEVSQAGRQVNRETACLAGRLPRMQVAWQKFSRQASYNPGSLLGMQAP